MHYFLFHHPFFSVFFFTFSLSLFILLKVHKNGRKPHRQNDKPNIKISSFSHPSVDINKNHNNNENNSSDYSDINVNNHSNDEEADKNGDNNKHKLHESDPTHLTHSLLLSFLPSDSTKWENLFDVDGNCDIDPNRAGPGQEVEPAERGEQQGKRKKKRAKKKRPDANNGEEEGNEKENGGLGVVSECPFTTSSSATQRKIKQKYDQLVKSHKSNGLTLAQVGQFVNSLIEARNELQHKSDIIQRRFTITKALLSRADRSSFDRLRQQIYKLEVEQKRLEEDACVYNWLQQQLKLSPAYKKMLEISASMEMKAKSSTVIDSTDAEFTDISFEELLAREKKDSFWQRHGKPRLRSG